MQVSPPHASRSLGTWHDVYQPVNYTKLNSSMGNGNRQAVTPACGATMTLDAGSFKS
jgi:alpha-amylase